MKTAILVVLVAALGIGVAFVFAPATTVNPAADPLFGGADTRSAKELQQAIGKRQKLIDANENMSAMGGLKNQQKIDRERLESLRSK